MKSSAAILWTETQIPHAQVISLGMMVCSVLSGGRSIYTSFCVLIVTLDSVSILTISTQPSNDAAMSGVQPSCVDYNVQCGPGRVQYCTHEQLDKV